MENKNGEKKPKKRTTFSALMENNKVVFVLSLVLSMIIWCGVSMYQTPESEKTFQSVKVQLNVAGSMPDNNGLALYGQKEYTVDVTVRGKSYLVNDSSFTNDNISVTVNLASIVSAGTYSLPLTASLTGISNDVEITGISRTYIEVYFDEPVQKNFELTGQVDELDGYSLPEGYVRENSTLSVTTIDLTGPSLEINRITKVTALVELDKEITKTESYKAQIIPSGTSANADFSDVKPVSDTEVYISVPVSYKGEYETEVEFKNAPQSYKNTPPAYTVSPATVSVTLPGSNDPVIGTEKISVGNIDFSEINNTVNVKRLSAEGLGYTFNENITDFSVTIDMSSMQKRWLEIAVKADDVPVNITVVSKSVVSVQVIGPSSSVAGIDAGELYATPVLDGITLEKGTMTVPAKLSFRTLTDSWVYGTYTIEIVVS